MQGQLNSIEKYFSFVQLKLFFFFFLPLPHQTAARSHMQFSPGGDEQKKTLKHFCFCLLLPSGGCRKITGRWKRERKKKRKVGKNKNKKTNKIKKKKLFHISCSFEQQRWRCREEVNSESRSLIPCGWRRCSASGGSPTFGSCWSERASERQPPSLPPTATTKSKHVRSSTQSLVGWQRLKK